MHDSRAFSISVHRAGYTARIELFIGWNCCICGGEHEDVIVFAVCAMEFLAQYDDISDGENEAEQQAMQLAAQAVQKHVDAPVQGAEVHSIGNASDAGGDAEQKVEPESEDESVEDDSESEEEITTTAPVVSNTVLNDLHYVAMMVGQLEAEQSMAETVDPNEIGIDSLEDEAAGHIVGETGFSGESGRISAKSGADSSSDTSSDTSDDDDEEQPLGGDGVEDAVDLFTEEELQSGVPPDEVPRTKNEIEPEVAPLEVQIAPDDPIAIVGKVLTAIFVARLLDIVVSNVGCIVHVCIR